MLISLFLWQLVQLTFVCVCLQVPFRFTSSHIQGLSNQSDIWNLSGSLFALICDGSLFSLSLCSNLSSNHLLWLRTPEMSPPLFIPLSLNSHALINTYIYTSDVKTSIRYWISPLYHLHLSLYPSILVVCFSWLYPAFYSAAPLTSAGIIPIMQSLCPDGQRDEFGFLQYKNSTWVRNLSTYALFLDLYLCMTKTAVMDSVLTQPACFYGVNSSHHYHL